MLFDLKILNGDMALKFDKYVNTYTVNVESDVTYLELEYKINDDDEIIITSNENFSYGLNYVFIEVKNKDGSNIYTIEVYRKRENSVMKYEKYDSNISQNENLQNYPYIICIVCILVILFFFYRIFCRKRSK